MRMFKCYSGNHGNVTGHSKRKGRWRPPGAIPLRKCNRSGFDLGIGVSVYLSPLRAGAGAQRRAESLENYRKEERVGRKNLV